MATLASGSNNLTTYYAKRIIGDSNAQTSATALLQTGTNITADLWILGNTAHTTYGIKYVYDSNSHDKLEAWGGGSAATAWVQLDNGNTYILGQVGIGYDPNTSGNTYKLYVDGTGYFSNSLTTASGLYAACIELSSATPYIDFHFNSSSADYTSRIIESASGYLQIPESFGVGGQNTSYKYYVNGTTYLNGALTMNGYYFNNNIDIPEGAANLNSAAAQHRITFYRNGFLIPYQMDDANDGGFFRVRGTSESTCIAELGTWDDSGAGETIQFNYYPTTSQITPTYSVSVPKHSGTLVTTDGYGASGTWGISISGNAATATTATYANLLNINNRDPIKGDSHLEFQQFHGSNGTGWANRNPTNDWYHHLRMNHGNSAGYFVDLAFCFHAENNFVRRVASGSDNGWKRLWTQGNAVTNAVWNDLAESRKSELREPGYVITPSGVRTTKRLEPGCRITSDTWGFALGDENDETKMPVAISGRVLAYPARLREEYHLGDCVCSAPDGKVDIMTRQEIRDWPDCIIGIVNEIPDYEEWGSDEKDNTGRGKIKINGRIWIDIK